MNKQAQGKVITCIFPKGRSVGVMQALHEKGVSRINFAYARGFDIQDNVETKKGFPDEDEKEILTVVADSDQQAEELFALIYDIGKIGLSGGGIMYQSGINGAMAYTLPSL